ncbi:hypothetical protein PENTCL1PPCAC_5227, partial [Pristionchus entomophagus]
MNQCGSTGSPELFIRADTFGITFLNGLNYHATVHRIDDSNYRIVADSTAKKEQVKMICESVLIRNGGYPTLQFLTFSGETLQSNVNCCDKSLDATEIVIICMAGLLLMAAAAAGCCTVAQKLRVRKIARKATTNGQHKSTASAEKSITPWSTDLYTEQNQPIPPPYSAIFIEQPNEKPPAYSLEFVNA